MKDYFDLFKFFIKLNNVVKDIKFGFMYFLVNVFFIGYYCLVRENVEYGIKNVNIKGGF